MATWYVNAARPSSGAGTSAGTAFRTLAEGRAAMSPGDTLRVAGGFYAETLDLSGIVATAGAPTRVLGDPDDWFVISGGAALPGLTRCTAADAPDVGSGWASVFKSTLAKNALPAGSPWSANICEGTRQLVIATERADRSDTFFVTKPAYYHTADSVTTSGLYITGFKKPSVTDRYTKTQLERAQIRFVQPPNVAAASTVNFDATTKVLGLTGVFEYENSAVKNNFALANLLPSIRQGEWAFIESGSNVTIYVRPMDEASVAAGLISYSVRQTGLDLSGSHHIEVANFVVNQIASGGKDVAPILSRNTGTHAEGQHVHDYSVENSLGFTWVDPADGKTKSGDAAVYMTGVNDLHMHGFKVMRSQSLFGIFLQGNNAGAADWRRLGYNDGLAVADGVTVTGQTSGATCVTLFQHRKSGDLSAGTGLGWFCFAPGSLAGAFQAGENLLVDGRVVGTHHSAENDLTNPAAASAVRQSLRAHLHDFEIRYASSASIRCYTQKDLAIHHGLIHDAAKESHGNTINFYQGCHNCLVWGLNGEGSDGYYTWQESDSIVFAFCAGSASTAPSGGAKVIEEQQNRFSELPGAYHGWLGSCVLNCRGVPNPAKVTDLRYGNSFNVSSSNAPLNRFTVWNNIHHGSAAESGAALDDWDHNINTKGSGTGTGKRGPNDVVVDAMSFYNDPVAGDFGYPAGSAVRTFAAKDWSGLIPGFRARWPQVPAEAFARDMAGAAIDWSRPPVGPTVDPDADYRAAAVTGEPVVPPPPPPPPPDPETPVRPVVRSRVLRLSVTAAAP